MTNTCKPLIGNIKPSAFGVSLCKGFYVNEAGSVDLISNMVKNQLNIECCVVMGANIANEVANENFCEATIGKNSLPYLKLSVGLFLVDLNKLKGSKNVENGNLLKQALQTPYFRIVTVKDAEVVESCGALKVKL